MNDEGLIIDKKVLEGDSYYNIKHLLGSILSDIKPNHNVNISNSMEIIKSEYERLIKIRDNKDGFESIKAIALTSLCLIQHKYGLEDKIRLEAEKNLKLCAEINYLASYYYKSEKKKENWFNLSKKIVKSIFDEPRNIMIQVGTPKKAIETSSTHAFYVTLKHIKELEFQIIIVNGGGIADKLHFRVEDQNTKERKIIIL